MKPNPCKGCTPETGRSATCHSTCDKYIKWQKKHKEELAMIRKKKEEMRIAMTTDEHDRWQKMLGR